MAAPVWQSKGTDLTGSPSTSAVVALPASLAAGDLVIVALYKENLNAVTPAAGYAEIATGGMPIGTSVGGTNDHMLHAFWFRCVGGETGTVTFSWTGSVFRAASASRVTGAAAAGDPIEAVNAAFNNTPASTSPSVSLPAGSGADTLLFWLGGNFIGGNAWAAASPSFTERTDIDVLAVDTRSNVGGGTTGSVTATSAVSGTQTAALFSITSGAPAVPAGLWAQPPRGLILPQNPLYFPFQRPIWAGADFTGAPAATGTGDIAQRSSTATTTAKAGSGAATAAGRAATASTGLKITSGGTVDPQRSATVTTDRKSGIGAGLDQQRTTSTVTSQKAAAGAGLDLQRAATSSTGSATAAGVSGVGAAAQRSATSSTGVKTAASAAVDQQRSNTAETGRKTAAGAARDLQRSTSTVTSRKAAAGPGRDDQRTATASSGGQVVGIGGAGQATQRSSVTSTGRKTTTAAALTTCRAATTGSGTHRAAGPALATTRSHDRATGLRATSGAARVNQRCAVVATGQQFALFTPLTNPATAVRGNDAAGLPVAHLAAATAGNSATAGQRANLAAATARPNPAEATT